MLNFFGKNEKLMENIGLLFQRNDIKNNPKNIIVNKGYLVYKNKDRSFSGKSIKKIIGFINSFKRKYPKLKIPIVLELGTIEFVDKLTYIFLEIICYRLIKDYGHTVKVLFCCKHNIWIEGIASSPLLLLDDGDKQKQYKFLEKFNDEIYRNHYRRVLKQGDNKIELSKRMDEVASFLKFSGVDDKSIDELSEVIIELVGNAWEHSSSECLLDLDVTNSYFKRETKNQDEFLGVNIAVVNFSNILLGHSLKEKLISCDSDMFERPEYGRYKYVKSAHENHTSFWGENYNEEDFFNMASFQHKISGRKDKTATGGTGLTKLISSMEKRSDSHRCYLITGDRALWFYHEYLEYDQDGWLGFNKENDFLNKIPSEEVFSPSTIFMPGTAYNLNFVIKGEN